jgi:hypothetical protein
MLRRLALITTIFVLIVFPFIFATPTQAVFEELSGNNTLDKYLQDFCAKRQGGQMNLETWYSGKCPKKGDTFDTFSGEGVGFSDIILLDLAEKVSGQKDPNQTFLQVLEKAFIFLRDNKLLTSSPEEKQLAIQSARQEIFNSQNNGLVDDAGKMVSFIFHSQPASTYSYLAYVSGNLQKHKIIPDALAAPSSSLGTGFSTFYAFLPLWTAMRNISYLGLIVFFIVYGFMIMFRVNLGQKTVTTVQLAIPKLVVTLLIITFSYAIVGLMIDFMWVIIYFSLSLLKSQGLITSGAIGSIEWYPGRIVSGQSGIFWSLIVNTIVSVPSAVYGVLSIIIGAPSLITGIATAGLLTVGLGAGPGLLIGIVIALAVLISYVKLFLKLLSSFISIIISLVIGPITLLGNAFPGSTAIGTWFRGLLANISVFPITMLFLLFSYMLMVQPVLKLCGGIAVTFGGEETACEGVFGVKNLNNDSSNLVMPIITPTSGLLGNSFDSSGVLALLGVGLLLMASKYVDIVKDTLKVPPFKYGTDIMKALESGVSANAKWAEGGYQLPIKGKASRDFSTYMSSNQKENALAAKETLESTKKL